VLGGFLMLSDEHGGGYYGRPEPLLVANGGLCGVLSPEDLLRQPVHFLLFLPALFGVELEAHRGREHLGSELLGIVARDVFALSEAVVLGQVTVRIAIARDGDADRRGDEAMRLAGGRLRHDDEGDLAWLEELHPLRAREDAALRREN